MLASRFSLARSHVGSGALAPLAIARATSLALVGLVALAACKEAADPAKVASIVGLPAADSVRLGKTASWTVETRDASGNKLTGRKIAWSSVSPNIATVDASGVVTGLAYGTTTIVARADDVTAQSAITVQQAVASVVLFPSTSAVARGSSQNLTVAITDATGKALTGRSVAFSSSRPDIATVNGNGTVLAVAEGRAIITASAVLDQVSGSATVDVVPVSVSSISITPAGGQTVFEGSTLQLSAVTRDGTGNILTGRPVSWTTSNQSVATVSSGGLVSGAALGTTQITAESEGKTASTQITVSPRPVATISLTPNPTEVTVNASIQMSVSIRDANGNQLSLTGRSVVWDSSNKPVATVDGGVVRGVSPGTATISVTVDGRSASAVVTVVPP
ncbi:MAG TPA: Ig-like domain-containing protein [Gemmatimonadaceae bacterium]|nr:Ig-like domain-containing protein [Gemmatimonadaceae bacterium]